MYSYRPPHMAAQKQDDRHEHTFSSYVRIRDAVLKTYLGRWTIGRSGESGSGISVLPARYDDDEFVQICISRKSKNFIASWKIFTTFCQLVQIYMICSNQRQFWRIFIYIKLRKLVWSSILFYIELKDRALSFYECPYTRCLRQDAISVECGSPHIVNIIYILFTQPLRSGRIWQKVNFFF